MEPAAVQNADTAYVAEAQLQVDLGTWCQAQETAAVLNTFHEEMD